MSDLVANMLPDPPQCSREDGTCPAFPLNQQAKFFENLDKLPPDFTDVVEVCKRLLDYQIDFIIAAWSMVPKSKQPQIIKDQLKKYKQYFLQN